MHPELAPLGVALAVGLLIGVERGWHEREAEEGRRIAGVRTYGLIGLLGGIAALLADRLDPAVLGYAFAALAIVLAAAYVANLGRQTDAGITSLVAGLLTFGLGALAGLGEMAAAAAAAVVSALLLGMKPVLHGLLRRIEPQELRAALKLLLISVVLLPVLPDRGFGPWHALNPYTLWWMVVLVAAISFFGYFAVKLAGPEKGTLFTSLFAGLASSTALTLYFARLARRGDDLAPLLGAGILLACGTMLPRTLLLAAVVNPALLRPLILPVVAMAVPVYLPALVLWWRSPTPRGHDPHPLRNPLELGTALRFGVLLAAIMVLAAGLEKLAGEAGIFLLSAASGIADVDAVTLSLARLAHGDLAVSAAVTGIVIAAGVNTFVKAALAAGIGGRRLGWTVLPPLLVAAVAGPAALLWLR